MKLCRKCKVFKENSLFTTRKKSKDGLDYYCKTCNDLYRKSYFSKIENKIKRNQNLFDYRRNNPKYSLFNLAKKRAKLNNLEFNININDITIPEKCPIFGTPIYIEQNYRSDNSISIDRIDSKKGYTKENIIVVSWKANRIKNNATIQEMYSILNYLVNKPKIQSVHESLNNNKYINELIRSAKKRAIKKNIKFNLKKEDIIIPKRCPILGIKISKGSINNKNSSPSIDRYDNNCAYDANNICVISWRANYLKNNASLNEYNLIYNFYKNILY